MAVELLTTTDATRARVLAAQLEGLNNQRRLIERQIYAAAQEQIARDPALLEFEALVLGHSAWHPGIIGIVASRLAERYERPVVLFSIGEDGRARGSARSTPGYDIGTAIAAQADLLIEHGGHPGAAGLSLHTDNLPAFRRRVSNTLHATRDPSAHPGLTIDAYVPLSELTLDLAAELDRLAPFGEGNPRVVLATCDLHLKSAAYVGAGQQHRRLTVADQNGTQRRIMWWNSGDQPLPEGLFDAAYELDTRMFEGNVELQLTAVDFRRSASAPVEIARPPRQVQDYRGAPFPEKLLRETLDQYPGAAVWAEGYRRAESPGVPLAELPSSDILVVFTAPPGPQSLTQALERVNPDRVILFDVPPPIHDVGQRISELVKYVLNQQAGQTTLSAVAAATGQTFATIRLALECYAAQGIISVTWNKKDSVLISPGTGLPAASAPDLLAAFQASVAETAAYRAYFSRADPYRVLGWTEGE
jgi:single-stranded-DNA-specific exonuclease